MSMFAMQADLPGWSASPPGRIALFALIVLLHLAFFVALQNGLRLPTLQDTPKEIVATLISLEPTPESPKPPAPEPPKTVPIVKNTVIPKAPVPVVNTTPAPNAITTPAVAPTPQLSTPPAVAAPAAPAQPKTVSGVEYIQRSEPDYPPASKRMGEEGTATFRVLINERGRAESMELRKSSGSSRLDEAARQALFRSVFKPYTENGKAIPVFVIAPVTFTLD